MIFASNLQIRKGLRCPLVCALPTCSLTFLWTRRRGYRYLHCPEEEREAVHKLVTESGIPHPPLPAPGPGSLNLWAVTLCNLNEGEWRWGGVGKIFKLGSFSSLQPLKKRHRTKEECTFPMHNSLQPSDEVPQKLSSHQSWRDRIGWAQCWNEWLKRTAETKELFMQRNPKSGANPSCSFYLTKGR